MRRSIALLVLLMGSSVASADDQTNLAVVRLKLWLLGGSVSTQGDDTFMSFVGSQKLHDNDLEGIIKAYPKLTQLAIGRTNISDAGLKHVAAAQELQFLGLIGTKVTDAGLKELRSLKKLDTLFLADTAITDAGLKSLGEITSLQTLLLGFTQITDEGLKELRPLQNLVQLELDQTSITDAGLEELGELKQLQSLDVSGTKVTEAGVKKLRERLPKLEITGIPGADGVVQQGGGGGQHSDPNFDATVANPAYTNQHPKILFDEAHDNFHTSTGRYQPFADLLRNDGYEIQPGVDSITLESLSDYQVLITANAPAKSELAPSAFTVAECDAIEAWVKKGGSLLLITDHEPFGSGSQELGKRFGVDMGLMVTTDPANESTKGLLFVRDKNQIGDHPIMTGRNETERVNRVLTFTGQSLQGPPGSSMLLKLSDTAVDIRWDNSNRSGLGGRIQSLLGALTGQQPERSEVSAAGRAQGIAFKHGAGRVVVMGEAAELSAQMVGTERFGMNVPDCDNRKMALNIMHWLSGLLDDPTTDAK